MAASFFNSAAPASKMSEGAGEQLFSCSVRPAAHKLSHRTFFARSHAPDFPSAWAAPPLRLFSSRGARSLSSSLSLWQCSLGRRWGGGSARRPLRGGKQKESREQMLQILLSAGGPVWSEEQRIEGARSWDQAEEGAPSFALGLSRMRERKELAHWQRQYRGRDGCPTFNFNHGGSVPSTCAGRTAGLTASGRAGAEGGARTREPSPASQHQHCTLPRSKDRRRREEKGEERRERHF